MTTRGESPLLIIQHIVESRSKMQFEVVMTKTRETPGTFRFENADDNNLKVIYVRKDAFGGTAPNVIKVTVEVTS